MVTLRFGAFVAVDIFRPILPKAPGMSSGVICANESDRPKPVDQLHSAAACPSDANQTTS